MECYQSCALPPLPHYKSSVLDAPLIDAFQSIVQEIISGDLQQRLQKAMDAILESWSARHDSLIDQLNLQVEVQRTLQSTIETQALRYQKAVRETYFYQTKYEQAANAYARMKRRQNDRRNSYNSYESCVSSLSSYSTMGARSRIYSEDDDDSDRCTPYPSSLASPTLSLPPISPLLPLPSSPSWLDQVTPLRPDSPTLMPNFPAESNEDELPDQGTPPEQEENGSLQFACGDGFWDTIARGKGEKEEVDRLISNYLRRGGRPNVAKISATVKSVKEGYSLIHALIAIKNTSALQRVIEAGANPNVLPLTTHANDKISPLVLAAKIGYLNGVRLLLERTNADILSRGPQQETALHAAVEHDNPEIVTYLIRQSKFTLLEQVDAAGATALHYACMAGKTRLVTLLIRDCQVRPDARDDKGETPLHWAVRSRRPKVVARMIELGVYPNPYSKNVPTPLDIAKCGGLKTIAEYLRKMGAKTTKEMEKTHIRASMLSSVSSSDCSSISDESRHSECSSTISKRRFLKSKTSMMLRNKIDEFMSGTS